MSQIFISYARKDSDEVYPIVDMLESYGLSCWIDKEGIESGSSEFENVILDAIDSSEVFLHLLSPNSKTSKYVKEEYEYAANVKKRIVTVLLHGAIDNPRVMFGFQTVDLIDIYNETQKEKLLRDLRKWTKNNDSVPVGKENIPGDVNGKGSFDNPSSNSQSDKQSTFTVELKSCGINKLAVMMMIVNQKLAPGLAKANSIIDTKPSVLWTGADANKAEQLKKTFEALGAEIEIISKKQGPKPSTSNPSGDVNGKGSFDNPSPNSQSDKHPTFTVVLKSCGINKINVMMKIVDQKLAPDLAKANSIIDTKPSVLWTGADANKAEQLKKTFEALGAEIEIISKKQGPKPSTSNSSESSHASKDETEVGNYEVVCSICGKKEKKFFDRQEVIKGLGLALLFQPLLGSGTKKVWQKMGGSYICPECKAKQEKES